MKPMLLETKDKITNIKGKIAFGRFEIGKRKARGVVEFLRVKRLISISGKTTSSVDKS